MLADYAVAAMHRQTDAATHEDTVDQSDERLLVFADQGVAAVFVMPEFLPISRAVRSAVGQLADIAAGAESLVASRLDDHRPDRRILRPVAQVAFQRHAHGMRSETRRVGKGCVRTCKSRLSPLT